MKFIFTSSILVCLFLLFSCEEARVLPFKNSYQEKAYEFSTSFNKDQTWDKIIDFLMEKGLTIKSMDKIDGLITTDFTSFLNTYTLERKDGSLFNDNAYVVCSRYRASLTVVYTLRPTVIYGQWIVRLKQESDKTVVTLKLANATGKFGSDQALVTAITPDDLLVKSTGLFEKTVEVFCKQQRAL